MKQFDFGKTNELLDKVDKLVKEGVNYGLNLQSLLSKIESIRGAIKDGIVRIVLLGSFSDGKTTAIAGLLGRLEDTMKIDSDESSDELKVYRPLGLKKGFEIVDTPGLFGTKEKEVNGENIKFSDITKRYISEAHIIIYVCDAVNPLKDSHVGVIKWVLRDLGKLDSTIFVINKMDEAGYDMLDEEDYEFGSKVKKENLISRLRTTMNLIPDEGSRLHIVCIAADPKGKGLPYWFSKEGDYLKRSHIENLRNVLSNVVNSSDAGRLKGKATAASIKDIVSSTKMAIDQTIKPLEKSLPKAEEAGRDMALEKNNLSKELEVSKKSLVEDFDCYRNSLIAEVKGASEETFGGILESKVGIGADGNLSFSIFEREVDNILQGAASNIDSAVKSSSISFEKGFGAQEKFLLGAAQEGSKYLKGIKIDNTQVLAIRDTLFKNIKFKPYGAIKLANKITKGFGWAAAGLNIGMEFYGWYKKWKQAKELDEAKAQVLNVLRGAFDEIDKSFRSKEAYIKNFAPQYIELEKALKERENQIAVLKQRVKDLEAYSSKVKAFLDAEDADYKEV